MNDTNNINILPKWLRSSDGTGRLSSRVSAILAGLLPIIVIVAQLFGFKLSVDESQAGINLVVNLIAGVETIIAIIWLIKAWADRNFRKENKLGAFAEQGEIKE